MNIFMLHTFLSPILRHPPAVRVDLVLVVIECALATIVVEMKR